MELKLLLTLRLSLHGAVLIVPFMELKLALLSGRLVALVGLNRTFYGIETS